MAEIKLQKWGNSHGIRLSKNILEQVGLNNLDQEDIVFEIEINENTILLTPKVELTPYEKLFIGYEPKKEKVQFNWDEPIGNEYW